MSKSRDDANDFVFSSLRSVSVFSMISFVIWSFVVILGGFVPTWRINGVDPFSQWFFALPVLTISAIMVTIALKNMRNRLIGPIINVRNSSISKYLNADPDFRKLSTTSKYKKLYEVTFQSAEAESQSFAILYILGFYISLQLFLSFLVFYQFVPIMNFIASNLLSAGFVWLISTGT